MGRPTKAGIHQSGVSRHLRILSEAGSVSRRADEGRLRVVVGPQGFRVEVQELDAGAGGALRYEMIADAPGAIATRSTFTELERYMRLVLTNVLDFIPGVAPYESHIAADFFATSGGVRMVVTLARRRMDEAPGAGHDEPAREARRAVWTSVKRSKICARNWASVSKCPRKRETRPG